MFVTSYLLYDTGHRHHYDTLLFSRNPEPEIAENDFLGKWYYSRQENQTPDLDSIVLTKTPDDHFDNGIKCYATMEFGCDLHSFNCLKNYFIESSYEPQEGDNSNYYKWVIQNGYPCYWEIDVTTRRLYLINKKDHEIKRVFHYRFTENNLILTFLKSVEYDSVITYRNRTEISKSYPFGKWYHCTDANQLSTGDSMLFVRDSCCFDYKKTTSFHWSESSCETLFFSGIVDIEYCTEKHIEVSKFESSWPNSWNLEIDTNEQRVYSKYKREINFKYQIIDDQLLLIKVKDD
ncbi:MAG: hypothetical protein GC181_12240 [Bacteroidetes bacterium]|nr:hypothetical protein [Bacteroidota bacterium]